MNHTLEHKRIYLDHASSTPIDPAVLEVLTTLQSTCFGNASGVHKEGVEASRILESARASIANTLGAHSDELIFTSGGTESDNLALMGVLYAFQKIHPKKVPHIIISVIEHPAIFELAQTLEKRGVVEVSYAPVTKDGVIDQGEFKKLLREETILVSIMQANNEIGTLQPIREIAKTIRHFKKHRDGVANPYPYFHTDACQSFVYEGIGVEQLGVDLLTINSSKIYGPKGVGALFVKRGTQIESLIIGGSQERNLRAGTENVPLIAGMARAVEINEAQKENESIRLTELRDYFIQELKSNFEIELHGSQIERLPNNINVSFVGYQSEQIVIYLDAQGVAVSEKSACKADSGEVSHVLKALYGENNEILKWGSVRFSLGRQTTKGDLDVVINKLKAILNLLTKNSIKCYHICKFVGLF